MEALQWATQQFKTCSTLVCESPLLEAETLLSEILQKPKALLIAHMEQELTQKQWERFETWVVRRSCCEPVAYLVGTKEFYGRSFIVNPSVLIPRPATEALIDRALAQTKNLHPDHALIVDVGTGSGAIAITMVLESGIPAIATDISNEALCIAKENAKRLGAEEKIHFLEGDLLDPLLPLLKSMAEKKKQQPVTEDLTAMLICANLPYLSQTQWENAQQDVKNYEPQIALTAGVDGLDLYEELFGQLKKYRPLFPSELTILCEMDPEQSHQMTHLISRRFPFSEWQITKDLEGHDRVMEVTL